MAKLTLTQLASLTQSALATLNTNLDAIEAAIENTLSRDGTTPNTMEADLDMNSNQILNLPAAATNTEPVRKAEFDTLEARVDTVETDIGQIDTQISAANAAVAEAEAAVTAALALDDYYITIWNPELIENSERLIDHEFVTTVVFPVSLTGSRVTCRTAATLQKQIDIQKNDISVGTITFAIGADTGTFTFTTETTFLSGDTLSLIGPASTDATLAGIAISLVGAKA